MTYFSGSARARAYWISLGWLVALFGLVSAQAQQGPPIVRSIDVEYSGPATVSKERILAQMRTAIGQPYSDQVV
ncbi:MAG TPA: hypothetical protein VN904_01840, partial [Chthoniobacterales bacterium]|nr:hypothetical protein [Chthoniobacterales bacterium]